MKHAVKHIPFADASGVPTKDRAPQEAGA